jgi:hypothetical protein
MKAGTLNIVKKVSFAAASVAKATKADFKAGTPVPFDIMDNGDQSYTLFGRSAAGNRVDITGLVTVTAVSDNTAALTVDPPTGPKVQTHAIGPVGTANVANVVTWNDGSVGPFSIDLVATIKAGAATGLDVVFDQPTTH